ncbi:MAG: hypothetical protein HYZ14_01325 [Bacteroidetes bacterium]|nr:hypothetical protein [Bacteroidota bacterium]
MKLFKTLTPQLFAGAFSALLLFSCGPSYIEQGEITYEITYPYNTDLSATMLMILPKEATLVFKGSKMLTIVKTGKIFRTDIYADEATKELEMRLDFGSDVLYTVLSDADQKKFRANLPNYKLSPTDEADSLNGLWGKKYTTKYDSDTIPEFDSWFTEDLSLRNITWFSNYAGTVGVPLIYDIDQYGIRMHLEVTGFKQREVKDEEFTRSSELKQVPYDEYDHKLNELFTILTE